MDVPELRDPDDAVIIGTAIAAKAKIIVSGDRPFTLTEIKEAIALCNDLEIGL